MKEEFNRLDDFLRILCKNNPKASFCFWVRQLMVNDRDINPEYYDDDVHLSDSGAKIMAKAIHRHLVNIPRIKN